MHDWITQVGVGGTFVLFTLKLILDYDKTKKAKKVDEDSPAMKEVGRRLLNLENRMGTAESAIYRGVGVMDIVAKQIDKLEERVWNSQP